MLEFFSRKKGEKGFTLIELLVVIAIIGVLATIVLVSLNTARSKARDTRRVSDMRQIALALEMYYDDNNAYPGDADAIDCDDWSTLSALVTDGQMGSLPEDPGTYTYAYEADTDKQNYVLRAQLENDVPDGDVDSTTYGCACDDASKYYCIQP
jgi:type II secretion system protein G